MTTRRIEGHRGARGAASALAFLALSAGGCHQVDTGSDEAPEIGEAQEALAPTCITVQRGLGGGVADTQIANKAPFKNYGTSQVANSGQVDGADRQTLLQFDISAVPPGVVLASAAVSLSQTNNGTASIDVHRVTAPWDESTVTWPTFGAAYSPAVETSFSNASPNVSFSVLGLAQGWVTGSIPNHGILLSQGGATNTRYWTSEYVVPSEQPKIDVCYDQACVPGLGNCDGDWANGCEATLTTNVNCGACGHACAPANAVGSCSTGACLINACAPGFADCNASAGDGCETSLTTNNDCGACGHTCSLPNAITTCGTGQCVFSACAPGFLDCDGNPSNGCEATSCPSGSACSADSQCTSGVCLNGTCVTPYSHTIQINGQNDFLAGETFQATSGGFRGFITWDANFLYFGMDNGDVNSHSSTKWVLIYLSGPGASTTTGQVYNTQQPGLPFPAKYHIRWKADNSFTNTMVWSGSSWVDAGWSWAGNAFQSGNYVEFRVPRSLIGSPTGVNVHMSMINEQPFAEGTYSGVPSTSFFDGYDRDYGKYFHFNLLSPNAPSSYPALP